MIALPPDGFHLVAPLFERIDHNIAIVYAVIERNSPGRIYVDDIYSPSVALLYAERAFFYVGGDENRANLPGSLVPLLFDEILPQTAEQELVLFSFSAAWWEQLDDLLKERGAIRIRRKVFQFNPRKFALRADWRASLPQGFVMRTIDPQLAGRYPAYQAIVDPASQRLGVCLMLGDEVVSECTSAFVGRGEAEVDIHTVERYRGRGFATLTASAFIEACLARGLAPNWSCWPERGASIALAHKLGFEERPDVPAHYWDGSAG
jgi:RimJ/RimL family protein N-acetyltransferase